MSNERYQRGDWLQSIIIEENEEVIIVIQNVYPDGYSYTYGEPDPNKMSMLHDSRRTADPYLKEEWRRLPRVEEMQFKEADWITPTRSNDFTPRLILAVRPTGYTWVYLGSTREYLSEDSSNPYYDGWVKYPGDEEMLAFSTELVPASPVKSINVVMKLNGDKPKS